MDEKDINQMSDEELQEFIRKFYADLNKQPDCSSCPVTSCSRRRLPRFQEEEDLSDEEQESD